MVILYVSTLNILRSGPLEGEINEIAMSNISTLDSTTH